jgi:competence protein ComFC
LKCISCEKFSLEIICEDCQKQLLGANLHKRELLDDFFVYSFYLFDDIKDLVNSKYQFYGDKIYKILAKLSFKKFAQNFNFDQTIYAIPIDDHTRHDFSQTALLANSLKSKKIIPLYNTLQAKNKIKYAGKDLAYREKNKRDFQYSGRSNLKVILVDDLVTTGLTMLEAKEKLQEYNCEVLFGLTLCDAKV